MTTTWMPNKLRLSNNRVYCCIILLEDEHSKHDVSYFALQEKNLRTHKPLAQ